MTSNVKHIDVVTSVPVTSGDATSASTTFGHETNKTTTSSHITCTSTSGATTSDHVTTAATTSAHVTSKATTSAHVTSVATASSHVTNKATTSSHVTTAATSSAHVTTAATASAHVTSVVTASTLVTSKPKTSAHVTSVSTASAHVTSVATASAHVTSAATASAHVTSAATASAHVTSAATASAHVTSVATALAHVTATVPTLVTSKPTSTHVTSVATTVAHVTSVAAASAHVISATAVQASVVTSPAVACGTHQLSNAPGGTHQLYQVVPVVQNGVPCRLLVPLNMVPSVTKVVTTGGKVQTADQPAASVSSRLPAGNSKFVLQQVKVASQPCTAAGNSAVVHVLSPAGSAAVAGETGKDGKVSGSVVPGAVISSPAGVSGAAGPGAVMSSPVGHSATSTVQKVIAMTPTIAPGSKLVPAAPVTSPGKPPPSAVIQVPASSVASPAAVYNIIKVTPPPPGGTLTIGPNTRLVVVSGSSTGVTQSLGPRTSAAVGNVAVVTPTVKAATSAKSSVLKTQACTLPVGRPMVTTSAGQHKIVFVPQTSTGTAQSSARVVPQTSRPATAQPAAQILPNKPSAAPKQVSMVQQNENVVLINGQPYKLIPCPTTTHIPVDALKSTAAATVSSAVAQTAAPGPVTVTSAVAQTAAPARQTQVTASNSTAGGVTSAWEGSPRTEETGSGSETESASPVRSEPGEGTVLKIDSVYSLKGASKAPGSPTCKDALASKTIAQASSAANTLKNIASIHSAVVNTPKKYIVVYPNKPATPPSPPCAVKQASVAQTATKPSEPADTKPGTPPASPVKVPANKTSPRQPAPDRTPAKQLDPKPADKTPTKQLAPKSVTEMYHSYAKAETPDVPIPQMKRSVTALMVRTTPLGKSNGTVAMGQDNPEPATLPPSKIFRLEPPRPNETIQDERVRRLKEILREREAAVEELRRRKKP